MSAAYEKTKAWRIAQGEKLTEIRRAEAQRYREKRPTFVKAQQKEATIRYRAKHGDRLRPIEAAQARARRRQDPIANAIRSKGFKARLLAKRELECGRKRPTHCELCAKLPKGRGFVVWDHCHVTGRFRGWICDCCNKALGLIDDSPELLLAMVDYLLEHRPNQTTESSALPNADKPTSTT